VIVAHELSRLWRSESEMHSIKEELEYLNVHVVTDDGIDTRIVGMDILIAVKGAMAKQELRQIVHRTHRALKGLALDGRSAGGKCYGYVAATKSASGRREIDEPQAREVRRIFAWYAAGKSPRWIAERLNEEGVLSPGSDWRRTARRRDGKWLASAIYGDPKRGSGILNNELYNSRETRTTLSDLVGGAITLMPKEIARELDVCCPLSTTTFRLAQLSSAFVDVRHPENRMTVDGSALPHTNSN
jgi:site-specific DNA recombinase